MSRIRPMKPPTQKPARKVADKARMARVAQLPCCICHEYGMPQNSPTQVHHCIHGRHGTARAPDCMTIPLCEGHHQGMFDTSKIALHREPAAWRQAYGTDTQWISWTDEKLSGRGQKIIPRSECLASGCNSRAFASGYCSSHYRRVKKYGDPLAGGTQTGGPLRWILENSNHSGSECLKWPFSDLDGYYSLSAGSGKFTKAHRKMCEVAHGPAKNGLVARHLCGNKNCLNPRHLAWGTPAENTADMAAHGTKLEGANSPSAKITEQDVIEIRRRRAAGEMLDEIAADYPIGKANVWAIAARKTWKHVK